MSFSSYLAFAVALTVSGGCSTGGSNQGTPVDSGAVISQPVAVGAHTVFLAIDTSGSAKLRDEELFDYAKDTLERLPRGTKVFIYRFNRKTEEAHSGEVPRQANLVGELLKPIIAQKVSAQGTDMWALLNKIYGQAASDQISDFQLIICTDSGTDGMLEGDIRGAKGLVPKLRATGMRQPVTFCGVQTGQREVIRRIFSGTQLDFK